MKPSKAELDRAWHDFRKTLTRKQRKMVHNLPGASPRPKAIVVTGNRRPARDKGWQSWGDQGRKSG